MAKKTRIVLISTGGTIEKTYDESDGSLANKESVIREYLISKLRLPYLNIDIYPIMAKDSLDMDDKDRNFLVENIRLYQKQGDPILILHGTDRMAKSAEYCLENLDKVEVPIIFTGGMKPLEISNSDSLQNVSEALMALQLVEPNIYISFHSKLFNVPGTRKNSHLRTFERYEI